MNKAKFDEVEKAAYAFATVTETGSRNAYKKREELLTEWVKRNCRDRKQNSRYIVYHETHNYGTKQWSDYGKWVVTHIFDPDRLRETEKSYIIDHASGGHTVISKDRVIGWLSK